ncbi:MAG TPA: phytoene/squalene synthase family protein [Dysgonamonadaceae bacterium]|jgi:phytoene synthase|nr:phytoene/squalene synthase family protein [Dysgonamonadaceae bacterium]
MGIDFFKQTSYQISKLITRNYSTSFSLSVSLLDKAERDAIYGIYGFVRLADEIVDSFDVSFDRKYLLGKLREDLQYALRYGISTNPVILSFADTVIQYKIAHSHINAFFRSMEYDLEKTNYSTRKELTDYIYGSAEVVGLMCLKVFCNGDEILYDQLFEYAKSLGSAFQKVNFLRDINSDTNELGRIYFPELTHSDLNEEVKSNIIHSIEEDFAHAKIGIDLLPGNAKKAVLLAYRYYLSLLEKLRRTPANQILHRRIRISDTKKMLILLSVILSNKLKIA